MEGVTVFSGKSGIIQVTEKLVIKDFLEVIKAFPPGKSFESVPFMVGETPMTIEVYPNGDDKMEYKGHVAIFLRNKSDKDINVKCQFITDVETRELDYDTVKANGEFGFFKFLTHYQCKEAFKDKDFVVTAKVEIAGENVMIIGKQKSGPAPKKRKFNVLENVYKNMKRTDYVLAFDGEEVRYRAQKNNCSHFLILSQVPCHKLILAAASPVLGAMVKNEHREAIENKAGIKLSREVGQ